MDCKIMGLIDAEVAKLPQKNKSQQYGQYEAGKKKLCLIFPGGAEHEYICKEVAKKYGI